MNKTQYLIFEIGRECNLGHLHEKCPNQHSDRYKHVDTSRAMSDDTIVNTAVAMIQEHGFQGLIGWHYYNEPTLELGRMIHLMDRISYLEKSARFVLWTNGTTFLKDFDWHSKPYAGFSEIHVSDYELNTHPCREDRLSVPRRAPRVWVHRGPLDDRLTATGAEPGRPESDAPCCRMFTEMIFDYYGNVHFCCYDWRGLGTRTHIDRGLADVLKLWQETREAMCGEVMRPRPKPETFRNAERIPNVCRTCTAPGRSPHITNFVKAPAVAARAYRQEVLNRGK